MPLTPFVYEFFLFNSLYQVNWTESFKVGELIFHSKELNELKKQREFIKYLKDFAKREPSSLYRAFEPLVYLPTIEGEWTTVKADARITKEQGRRFFEKIKSLQGYIEVCNNDDEMPTTKKVFDLIDDCTYYINSVRNNIFHGSKGLGEIYEENQKHRIEVYELFLKGITSLFFLSAGKDSVASDFIECSISIKSQERKILDQNLVWSAINKNLMKIGDSRLIFQVNKLLPSPKSIPSNKSVLFYPSSGTDILTPLLLALPYCTQFYFFDRGRVQNLQKFFEILRKIPMVKFNDTSQHSRWEKKGNTHYFEFEYDGIIRKIYRINSDNLEFLNLDVELNFYFHRGDSLGEGGSAQQWDSEYLPELIKKIPTDKRCLFLTDGEPGGIDKELVESCNELSIPFLERSRKYFFGYLANLRKY